MLHWESLKSEPYQISVFRAKVPSGWLVFVNRLGDEAGLTFYTDPNHSWDGTSK
jgi:hypothetical protein